MQHRRWNRLYARVLQYFWLPCPLCGQEFGGHEWRAYIDGKVGTIPTGMPGIGKGICPDCTAAGRGVEDPPRVYLP